MSVLDERFWLALFWALAVECGCVVLLALLLNRIIRSPFWRRTLWQATVICLLLLTASELSGFGRGLAAFALRSSVRQKQELPRESMTVSNAADEVLPDVALRSRLTVPPAMIWWPAFFWLVGFSIVMARVAVAQLFFAVLRLRCPKIINSDLNRRASAMLGPLGYRREVALLQASRLSSPIAFGVLRPVIALPPDFADRFNLPAQEAVLAHELAHLAAHDPLWYLLADLATALLWWHPLAWWTRRQLHRHCELVADQAVAVVPNGPVTLAECLVSLGRKMTVQGRFGLMGVNGGGFGSNLGERVESLLQLADGAWKPLRGWRVLAVKAGGTILLGGLVVCVCGWVEGPSAFEQSWHDSAASAVLMAAVDTNQSAPRPIANRNLDGRHRILSKLNRIRIDEVHYDLPLAEVIKQLQMESKKRDPDGDGINFLFNMQAAGLGGAATPSEYVNEITVKIDPPLRNLRLIDVLDAIAKTASKPVRWTVEDYAVVFSPKSTGEELLYTKVFRVDPHTFVQGLQNVRSIHLNTGTQTSGTGGGGSSAGTGVEIPGVQIIPSTPAAKAGLSDATKPKNAVDPDALIRAYFAAAGVDLSKPNKVVFFDDRLGRLLVRASRSDFEIIEQAVELLNQAPSQLTIEAKFVDVEEKSLQRLGLDWIKSEEKITAILTDAQFRSALAALEQRAKTDILSAPKVTTLSGRQTHISSTNEDGGVALDILATVASDGFTVQATVIPSVRTGTQIWTVVNTCNVWDGQTLVIGGLTTNQSSKVRKMRLVFVTPTIIDRAGNRMHTDNDMPFTRNSIPPQPPTTPH